MDEKQSTKYGFYEEFNVKNRNTQYQPLSQIISDTAHKASTLCSTKLTPSKSTCSRSNLFTIFPILQWLSTYELPWFKQDFLAGITVSILLVPQSLAYATLAGLPPEWGLYAAITPVFSYVIFGTSTRIAIGPVAPTAIMVASAVEVVAGIGDEDDREYMLKYETIAMSLSFVCGIMLFLFGLFRIGFITVFLSNPVMAGFIMSAASIILAEQFRSLLGLDIPRSPLFYKTLQNIFNAIDSIHSYTAIVSIVSLFFLYLPKWFPQKIPKWVPVPLFVIIAMVLGSWILDLESHGVDVVGNEVKTGFPIPSAPDSAYFVELIPGALVLSIVSYMGSIALAKGFDQKGREEHKEKLEIYNDYFNDPFVTKPLANTDTKSSKKKTPTTPLLHDKNQHVELSMSIHNTATIGKSVRKSTSAIPEKDSFAEMSKKKKVDVIPEKPLSLPSIQLNPDTEFVAFGIANIIGSFFGAQVISASFSRSGLNNDMRGHTQMSSVIQATICLLCLLFLMPLLAPLPNAVLASVVAISVHRLIKNGILQFILLWNVSRIELIEFMAALIAPWVVGLEIGVFIAIGVSITVSLIRHTFINIIQLGRLKTDGLSNNNEYVDAEIFHQANFVDNICILELKSELSFANSRKLIDKIRELLNDGNRYIVISLALTQIMDTTSIGEIVTLFGDAKGSYIAFTHCRPDVIEVIKRFEAMKKMFPHNIKMFISTDDAVLYFQSLMKNDGEEIRANKGDKTPERKDLNRKHDSKPLIVVGHLDALQDISTQSQSYTESDHHTDSSDDK